MTTTTTTTTLDVEDENNTRFYNEVCLLTMLHDRSIYFTYIFDPSIFKGIWVIVLNIELGFL